MLCCRRLFVTVGVCLALCACLYGGDARSPQEKETHKESPNLGASPKARFMSLSTLTLADDGNILGCDVATQQIKVLSPQGELLATWKPGLAPEAIHVSGNGCIYVGGRGKLAKLDSKGNVLKRAVGDAAQFPMGKVAGIATTDQDLFVSFGSGRSLRARGMIVRFDRDFGQPKTIAVGMRGCCRRLDIAAKDGYLYVAENARHRVVKMDRDGKIVATWGRRSRSGLEGFGSCCNPMNIDFGPDGMLYTSESGLGRVKRYTPDGKLLGLVGYIAVPRFNRASGFAASCSNVELAVSRDGGQVYVMDIKKNAIRVLTKQ